MILLSLNCELKRNEGDSEEGDDETKNHCELLGSWNVRRRDYEVRGVFAAGSRAFDF